MIQRLLSRLFGTCCCGTARAGATATPVTSCSSCSGAKEITSCLCQNSTCSPCDLDGYDVRCLCWSSVSVCSCEVEEASELVQNGFEEWRLDPVAVSARFLNNSCVPCDFRGKPAYLRCKRCISGKTYVLLGVSCVGDVAFELDSKDICADKKIYTVCRVAYICA